MLKHVRKDKQSSLFGDDRAKLLEGSLFVSATIYLFKEAKFVLFIFEAVHVVGITLLAKRQRTFADVIFMIVKNCCRTYVLVLKAYE